MRLGKRHFKEFDYIVKNDLYKVRDWKTGSFDYVIDIGANVGTFSIFMRMLHPEAKIIAIEPANETFSYLEMISEPFNIDITKRALGDGNPLYFKERNTPLDTLFLEDASKNSYSVESMTLPEIFMEYDIDYDRNYMIKLDCEGGEKYLIDNEESEQILRAAEQVSMEVHFRSRSTPYDFWPEWHVYDEWIRSVFTYHDIQYYVSNKHRGYGHYCLRHRGRDGSFYSSD